MPAKVRGLPRPTRDDAFSNATRTSITIHHHHGLNTERSRWALDGTSYNYRGYVKGEVDKTNELDKAWLMGAISDGWQRIFRLRH
jgi:hypothetical protein